MSDTTKKQYVYTEKKFFGLVERKITRPVIEGLEKMLEVPKGKKTLVEIRHLDITYGSGHRANRALKDLSFNIYDGEVLGLVGESGSGKSTTGSAIVGLLDQSFGSIKIGGRLLPPKVSKIKKDIEKFLINKVQMIFQDPSNSLNPFKNIESVVSEGLENISNTKEIFLYNYDQKVLKALAEILNKLPKVSQFEKTLQNELLEKASSLQIENYHSNLTYFEDLYEKTRTISKLEKDFNPVLKDTIIEMQKFSKLSIKEMKRKLIIEMINSVGLDESVLKRFPLEFSGGQQQRIGISRAIILRPKLLVADEPISALDVSIQAQVVNIFNDLKEKYDLTILFIAHDLRMVEYISDRIAVMNKGTLLEIGPKNEIIYKSLHPYTKSLLEAVPSIESKNGSLIGYVYNPEMHGYTLENQPKWNKISEGHFVLGTEKEIKDWKKGKY